MDNNESRSVSALRQDTFGCISLRTSRKQLPANNNDQGTSLNNSALAALPQAHPSNDGCAFFLNATVANFSYAIGMLLDHVPVTYDSSPCRELPVVSS